MNTERTLFTDTTWSPVVMREMDDYDCYLIYAYEMEGYRKASIRAVPKGVSEGRTLFIQGRYIDLVVAQAKCFERVLIEQTVRKTLENITIYE
jgi:hypothetical protein